MTETRGYELPFGRRQWTVTATGKQAHRIADDHIPANVPLALYVRLHSRVVRPLWQRTGVIYAD